MKQKIKIGLLGFFYLLFSVTLANSAPMSIVTGSTKGTYYQFGLNLASLLENNGIQLDVASSNGSVENVYAVFRRPNTQLGIVQADVLAFVSRVHTDPILKEIAKKIKMVFPLYNEEIHLIGHNSLQNFTDLAGKRVAIGTEGSGTYLTAQLLIEISGVKPLEVVTVGTNEALERLKNGTIDAMFYVAGYPVKLLAKEIGIEDNLVLIPIENDAITAFYPQTMIPAETYSWQNEAVSTVAVKAVLVSFNFRYDNCEKVGRVGQLLYENMEWLQQHGHPKWKVVDLDYPLKGWQQYDCVSSKLTPVASTTGTVGTVNPLLEAIKEVLQN